MFKVATVFIVLVFSNICFAEDTKNYEGIWQDKKNSHNYYSIHEKDGKLVLIDLPGIETSGHALKSAYMGAGNTDDFVMNRLEAVGIFNQLSLHFFSADDAMIYPICAVCGVVAIEIRKIF